MQNNLINGFNIQMAGGDATSGASIASSATKNNALNRKQTADYLIEREQATTEEEKEQIDEKYTNLSIEQAKAFTDKYNSDKDFADRYDKAKENNPDLEEFEGYVTWGLSPEYGDNIYTSQEVVEHKHLYFPSDYSVEEKRVFTTPSADPIIKDGTIAFGSFVLSKHPAGAVAVNLYNIIQANIEAYNGMKGDEIALKHSVVDGVSVGAGMAVPENAKIYFNIMQFIANKMIDKTKSQEEILKTYSGTKGGKK